LQYLITLLAQATISVIYVDIFNQHRQKQNKQGYNYQF